MPGYFHTVAWLFLFLVWIFLFATADVGNGVKGADGYKARKKHEREREEKEMRAY